MAVGAMAFPAVVCDAVVASELGVKAEHPGSPVPNELLSLPSCTDSVMDAPNELVEVALLAYRYTSDPEAIVPVYCTPMQAEPVAGGSAFGTLNIADEASLSLITTVPVEKLL